MQFSKIQDKSIVKGTRTFFLRANRRYESPSKRSSHSPFCVALLLRVSLLIFPRAHSCALPSLLSFFEWFTDNSRCAALHSLHFYPLLFLHHQPTSLRPEESRRFRKKLFAVQISTGYFCGGSIVCTFNICRIVGLLIYFAEWSLNESTLVHFLSN